MKWFREKPKFKCSKNNQICKGKQFTLNEYTIHTKDHLNGRITEKCPNECGDEFNFENLQNHFLNLKTEQNL